MIAKMIAFGETRDEARRLLAKALSDTTVFGVVTNKTLLMDIVLHPVFAAGGGTTSFLAKHELERGPPSATELAIAAFVVYWESGRELVELDGDVGWRSGGPMWSAVELDGTEIRISSERGRWVSGGVELQVAGEQHGALELIAGGVRKRVRYAIEDARVWIDDGSCARVYHNTTHAPVAKAEAQSGRITAPHDGAVTKVFVQPGDPVEERQLLIVIEAMKMEQQIRAGIAGKVGAIHVNAGDQVRTGQLLAELMEK
jgi:geranyl-CoA carboxylase alpha subunit